MPPALEPEDGAAGGPSGAPGGEGEQPLGQLRLALEQNSAVPGVALQALLDQPSVLRERLLMDVCVFARESLGTQGKRMLHFEDMDGLVTWLARALSVDRRVFGEMSQIFWRFDFSGDGFLSPEEGVNLLVCMLRRYRDVTARPKGGYIRLGGSIRTESLHGRFEVQRELGRGMQGQVVLCRDRRTHQEVVVKMYNKSSPTTSVEDITREFEILMQLRHPHIAHVFEIFQDWSNVYVVQEPYFGGDLTDALRQAKSCGVKIDEPWLARVIVQVLKGVSFLHSKTVMHCDLKEPNVMVTNSTDWHSPGVVVIDFGLASEFATKSMLLGTPGYMPPEVWDRGLWTPRGDVFSLGVMLFTMRTGRRPFTEGCSSFSEVQTQTREHHPVMPRGTQVLRDLVCTMLEKSFHRRPTVCKVMADDWFASATEADQEICETVLSDVLRCDEKRTLTRAILADVASRANLAQMKELNELFLRLDSDNDGCVSERELRDGLSELRWPEDQIDALVRALVGDRGELRYEEFMGMLMGAAEPAENELLWRVFNEADKLGRGFLDLDDVAALLQRPAVARVLGGRDIGELLREMDWNNDQRVTFESFRLCVQGVKREELVRGDGRRMSWGDMPLPTRLQGWQTGDRLQFYSMACRKWEDCEVVEVDRRTGAVQVDCCPGYWLQGLELHTRLRRPGTVLRYLNPLSWGPLWVQQVSRACSSRSLCGGDVAYLN